ncbi:MAG TPA: PHB depolymerase family esterase [bacterium]|jgi:phospholipase/carboxylesterase
MKHFLLLSALLFSLAAFAAPQSYKQIAEDAIKRGDIAKATEFYRKWTEADPTDATSLYNLACCYALAKHPDEALAALQRAAAAGWSDAGHTSEDPDLESLRTRKDFQSVLEQIAGNASSRSGGYIVHSCAQERLGEYVVVLPDSYDPNRKYELLILLHGYGQSPQEFAKAAQMINTEDFIYAVPQGPYTALDSDGKSYCFLRELENYREDTASIAQAASWVMHVADDVMTRYPIADKRVWLAGFSQGAALAHITAARYPERIAGYAAHGGYIIKGAISDKQLAAEKTQKVRVLITHAEDDPAVAYMEGVYASNMLKQSGLNVTFTQLGTGHAFDSAVCAKIADWLKAK